MSRRWKNNFRVFVVVQQEDIHRSLLHLFKMVGLVHTSATTTIPRSVEKKLRLGPNQTTMVLTPPEGTIHKAAWCESTVGTFRNWRFQATWERS